MKNFAKPKKKLGFGCMRLPLTGEEVDDAEFSRMIDFFLEEGFNYFDTAHGYLGGKSELAIKRCLTSRYPRDQYILTDKLTAAFFEREEEIRPFFESQLKACGVEYFDYYLMHAQNRDLFEKFKRCRAYETALALREEGKIRHFGISFHDRHDVLEMILTEYPQIEVVQLQFNYVDYEDHEVEGRKCYEVCRSFGKPVIVMEPVKGGSLAKLPLEAEKVFGALQGGSPASYAIRYAGSFEGIMMVLSGMSNLEQMEDNVSFMKDFQPLTEEERRAVARVQEIFLSQSLIPCTACRYCIDGCPRQISIPDLFACLNTEKQGGDGGQLYKVHTAERGKASDCIGCGKCETVCPQHLQIRKLLSQAAEQFEK